MNVKNKNIFSQKNNSTFLVSKILCLISCVSLFSCKDEVIDYQNNECKSNPAFVKKIGLNPSMSAFSTSEKRKMGLVLVQINAGNDTTNGGRKIYQDSSWIKAGWLGPLLLDPYGNCFVAPIPVINLLDNPTEKQNIIYKVDGVTGKMNEFIALPIKEKAATKNPYGIMGFTYLCESNTLYTSSIHGSTIKNEQGILYAINTADEKIIDKIEGIDILGMGISYFTEQRKLYFGSCRNSNIYSITLKKDGTFSGKPFFEFSIDGLGPRGDDKVRRIKFNKATGAMQVIGIEFNYNLTAPTEKQENMYEYIWNADTKKWVFNK